MEQTALKTILRNAAILTGIDTTTRPGTDSKTLEDVLQFRLSQYRLASGHSEQNPGNKLSLEETQLETALAALDCIEKLQEIIVELAQNHTHTDLGEINIGSKDLAQIRTLLSLVFKWAIESLLARIIAALPSQAALKSHHMATIIDLTSVPTDYKVLCSTLDRLFRIILPSGVDSPLFPLYHDWEYPEPAPSSSFEGFRCPGMAA